MADIKCNHSSDISLKDMKFKFILIMLVFLFFFTGLRG